MLEEIKIIFFHETVEVKSIWYLAVVNVAAMFHRSHKPDTWWNTPNSCTGEHALGCKLLYRDKELQGVSQRCNYVQLDAL